MDPKTHSAIFKNGGRKGSGRIRVCEGAKVNRCHKFDKVNLLNTVRENEPWRTRWRRLGLVALENWCDAEVERSELRVSFLKGWLALPGPSQDVTGLEWLLPWIMSLACQIKIAHLMMSKDVN